jgi:hypothetical protein
MSDHAPILFIHYGDASYLRHTIRAAQTSNPEKRLVFLGDESNRHLARLGVEHHVFNDFNYGPEIERFNRVFQLIKGENHTYRKLHGADHWTRFVFLRWFLILNFLRREKIDRFWTFDSDTLILAPLASREPRFSDLDCTEQCVAQCMNGYVSGQQVVSGYIEKINELFERPDYLEQQRAVLRKKPGLAFTEMNAYVAYREETSLKSVHLAKAIAGEAFDDAMCFTDCYERHPQKVKDRLVIKNLLLDPKAGVFVKELPSGENVRLLTLNLSWMPDYIYERLAPFATSRELPPPSGDNFRPLDIREPLHSRLRSQIHLTKDRILGLLKPSTS